MENLSLIFGSGWLSEFAFLGHRDGLSFVGVTLVDGCYFALLAHDLPALEVDGGGKCINLLLFLQFLLLLLSGFLLSLFLPLRVGVPHPVSLSLPLFAIPSLFFDYKLSFVFLFNLASILPLSK